MLQGSTWYNLLRGALEVAGGLLTGILLGFVIQYFPSMDQVGVHFRLCADVSTLASDRMFMRDEQMDSTLLHVFNGLCFSARNML